jgi:hypothetical protein
MLPTTPLAKSKFSNILVSQRAAICAKMFVSCRKNTRIVKDVASGLKMLCNTRVLVLPATPLNKKVFQIAKSGKSALPSRVVRTTLLTQGAVLNSLNLNIKLVRGSSNKSPFDAKVTGSRSFRNVSAGTSSISSVAFTRVAMLLHLNALFT